jgi:FMN phosphatase YigB (HAD superfamily)
MWMADLRVVTFSGPTVLRLTRPDALRMAVRSVVEERLPRAIPDFDGAWAQYEAERSRRRWLDQHEQPLESFLKDLARGDEGPTAKEVAQRFGESLEWHGDALPTLDYLRESGYRTILLLDLPVPLPPVWQERSKPWFDETVSSTDVLRRTPDPAPFQEAMRRLRVGASKVLAVGQGLVEDVQSAQAVHLRTALLERFGRPPPDPEAREWLRRVHGVELAEVTPDLRLRTLEDLPRALDAFA